jgi:polyhydroxyalkanoate synthase subunit PhaC
MPSMVERDAFEVGKDLALSPGAVVHRDEVGELIQYQPSTEQPAVTPQPQEADHAQLFRGRRHRCG